MRYSICIAFCFFIIAAAVGQDPGARNHRPKITDQRPISTDEENPVTIKLTDLEVKDRETGWIYPIGFTLKVYDGNNYTFNGTTITPALNFNGTLSVPVTVNDGEDDSEKYDVKIEVNPVNDVPVITGQQTLSTNENVSFAIQSSQLVITDPDDNVFTILLGDGPNYTTSGNVVTPSPDFTGILTIPVMVNDGKASSSWFNLELSVVPVNDIPKITGQQPLSTLENSPITIQFSNLMVTDSDNPYPAGFSLTLLPPGTNNYTIVGTTVIPAQNFDGVLSVPLTVSDGISTSDPFSLQITVLPGNKAPTIVGQLPLTINEDESTTIQLSQLKVEDSDNTYPNGFTLRILTGANYTSINNTVNPTLDFNGNLSVSLLVNDGASDSAPYNFLITIKPVNDPPKISKFESEPLMYTPGKGPVLITELLEITDVDNDSLTQAQIFIKSEGLILGADELVFQNTSRIKGSFDMQKGSILLSGKALVSDYVKAIRSIKYNFNQGFGVPFENKILSLSVSDGKATSEIKERQIKAGNAVVVNLDIPTAFTPNGDFANDTWSIKPLKRSDELSKAIVRIYNRKGTLLFETVGFDKEWDGKLNGEVLPADTYYYTIELNADYTASSFKGIVAILR